MKTTEVATAVGFQGTSAALTGHRELALLASHSPRLFPVQLGEMIPQQPVDKGVAAAGSAQKNALHRIVQERDVAPRGLPDTLLAPRLVYPAMTRGMRMFGRDTNPVRDSLTQPREKSRAFPDTV